MSNDTIANMVTCIRNATLRRERVAEVLDTHTTRSIAQILLEEGFVDGLRERKEATASWIVLTLRYQGRERRPSITAVRRISRPGLRVYSTHQNIPRVLGGIGIAILSTSQGIMIDRDARQKRLGGEVLCYVW